MFDTKEKEIMKWFTLLVLFAFAGFSTGATQAAWQVTATIPGNSVSTGVWVPEPEDPEEPEVLLGVVLNEIYPAPLTSKKPTPPSDREWVELFNNSNVSVDVAGWYIGELTGGQSNERLHEIIDKCPKNNVSKYVQPYDGASTVIPAGGLLVVEFCGGANYLHDLGDTVRLLDTNEVEVDAHTYPKTKQGKSHQRIPDGGVWTDPDPTPGEPNRVSRQDLIDSGFTEDEIATIELMLLAQGEYLIGEEPEEVTESLSQSQESEEKIEVSEERIDERKDVSIGGGGEMLQSAGVFEDEAVEEELPEEKLQDQNLGDTEEFEELESKEEEYLGEEFDKTEEIDETDDTTEEDGSEEEYIDAPSEEDGEKLEESPAIAEVVEDEPAVKEEVASAPAEDNDE